MKNSTGLASSLPERQYMPLRDYLNDSSGLVNEHLQLT